MKDTCTAYWWDHEAQEWVEEASADSLWALRPALRELRRRGYSAVSILVVNRNAEYPDTFRLHKYMEQT